MKAVLDTNILISAIGWEGNPQKILNYALDNKFKIVISPEILEEVKKVLFREKFEFIDKDKRNEFIFLLTELAEIVEIKTKVNVCRDKKDNKFIETALSAKVDFLVSGDEDLLSLKKYKDVKIIVAKEFLEILKNS